ncbi:alpha/beta fold hydrolase [Xanthobacter autotrophicus]|uniref:thioesterase II family protein n=1 Tax=Xanthobacter autotrophicus TaxID=280 RepID=UPI003729C471
MNIEPSPWFLGRARRETPRFRLFCLPFAGGNASFYTSWQAVIDPAIDVVPVQLPGHGGRIREAPLETMDEMADGLADAMVRRLDLPYAVFGHSMGALLAFETLRRLRARGALMPAALFVSARRAPHLPPSRPPLHVLSDAELVGELRALNGTPDVVLGDRELLDLLLPVIRADLTAVETYRFREILPFNFPIHAFGGSADSIAEDALQAWSRHATSGFSMRLFPGDHFYLNDHRLSVLLALGSLCPVTVGNGDP